MIPIKLLAKVCERENTNSSRAAGAHEGEAFAFNGVEENSYDSLEHPLPRTKFNGTPVRWEISRDPESGDDCAVETNLTTRSKSAQ